jgi:hypothetical protein
VAPEVAAEALVILLLSIPRPLQPVAAAVAPEVAEEVVLVILLLLIPRPLPPVAAAEVAEEVRPQLLLLPLMM